MDDAMLLIEPFDIDDGLLSNVTPERAFALGVEWAVARHALSTGGGAVVELTVHRINVDRVVLLGSRRGFFASSRPLGGGEWALIRFRRTRSQSND